ncbi:MAG: GGDEF domain-containing protein [Actinomycetota bacterium]
MADGEMAAGPDLSLLLRLTGTAVLVCDGDMRVAFATPHAERLLGRPPVGLEVTSLVADEDRGVFTAYLRRLPVLDRDSSAFCEVRLDAPGRTVVEVVGANHIGDPAVAGIVLVLHDVTHHLERIAEAQRRATTDPLTGLAKGLVVNDRLRQARRTRSTGSLAIVDLDRFEVVNATFGHVAGDAVLWQVARRIEAALPAELAATCARTGGDEFAILLPATPPTDAVAVLEGMLEAVAAPHHGGIVVRASAGIAPVGPDDAESFRAADAALYVAKAGGGGRVVVYDPGLPDHPTRAAAQIAVLTQEKEELARQAFTDPLTGIPNRRRFDEEIRALDARSRRDGRPYSLVFLDLDRFGVVNKMLGQEAGDATLRRVTQVLGVALRAGDSIYRIGGEELVVILPDTPLADGVRAAERMRGALADSCLPHPTDGRVTASYGVATFDGSVHADHVAVLRAANAAMRRAKASGRDQIVAEGGGAPGAS